MKLILSFFLLAMGLQSHAGLSTDDFNEMIQENQRAETDLRKKLQKGAGIDTRKQEYGKIDRSKIAVPREAEQVAVSGGSPAFKPQKDRTQKELQKMEMKRVAEELKEANSQ